MAQHRRRGEIVLEPEYLQGLSDRDLEEVRAMRDEVLEVETEVSYVRRLAQARIDILEAELDRRASGGSLGSLVAALPQILTDEGPRRDAATSRLPRHLAPDIPLQRGLERLVADSTLANLPTVPEDELRTTLDQLRELEHDVSGRRHALHQVIDAIEGELAERHKAGRV